MRTDLIVILVALLIGLPCVFIAADAFGTLMCDSLTGLRCYGALRVVLGL